MVDHTYTLNAGDALHSLDWNNTERTLHGYGVVDGAAVTINTGTLGSGNDALSVASGSAVVDRASHDVSAQAVDLAGADDLPRWDLVGVDTSGSVVVRSGTPEEAQIDGEATMETHRSVHKPIPPFDPGTTPLALIWVPANAGSVETGDLFDVRVPANIFVSDVEVTAGGQVDGVDVSGHAANPDAHHTQTTSSDIVHDDTQGGTAPDAHHNQTHDNADHSETYTVGNYEIQVDGTDGQGIINFHTQ